MILSRTQQNDIYEGIRAAQLDPADFEWSTGADRSRKTLRLAHRPTGAFLTFSLWQGEGHWMTWRPMFANGSAHGSGRTWDEASRIVSHWLAQVKRDHEAPDLWAEVAKARLQPDVAAHPDLLQPFTAEERKQLTAGLDEIEDFIVKGGPPDPDRTAAIRSRFAYLRGAVERANAKIDWWNIFVGQAVSMATEGLLNPNVYGALMGHAKNVLSAVFRFGVSLLTT